MPVCGSCSARFPQFAPQSQQMALRVMQLFHVGMALNVHRWRLRGWAAPVTARDGRERDRPLAVRCRRDYRPAACHLAQWGARSLAAWRPLSVRPVRRLRSVRPAYSPLAGVRRTNLTFREKAQPWLSRSSSSEWARSGTRSTGSSSPTRAPSEMAVPSKRSASTTRSKTRRSSRSTPRGSSTGCPSARSRPTRSGTCSPSPVTGRSSRACPVPRARSVAESKADKKVRYDELVKETFAIKESKTAPSRRGRPLRSGTPRRSGRAGRRGAPAPGALLPRRPSLRPAAASAEAAAPPRPRPPSARRDRAGDSEA